jgi:predicted RNA binding protein YcfA (HicA-like mRNA interferase family)/predicted RNase H-like HicB family nuclease
MKIWKVKEMIRYIEADGWFLFKTNGDHRQFKHPVKKSRVTIPGKLSDDFDPNIANSILKQAGLKIDPALNYDIMDKVIVTVGLTENNYSAYVNIRDGIAVATGETFEELKQQMTEAVEFHLEGMREDGEEIPETFSGQYELVFHFDVRSLLTHYKGIFTNSALGHMTGINQRQLQHYASGHSKPRKRQAERIEKALHNLGKELLVVEL